MENKQILAIGMGNLISIFLFGLANCFLWYIVNYFYYSGGFFNRDIGSLIAGVVGLILGVISGFIIGSLIIGFQLNNKLIIFILGTSINGLIPLLILLFLDGQIDFGDTPRDLKYSIYGQFIIGGIISILVSIIVNQTIHQSQDQLADKFL